MADRSLDLALRVSADTAEGRAALTALGQAMRGTGMAGRNALDPFTDSVARATRGADSLVTQLRPLSAALASVTAGIGVREVIQLADTYAQMTARLNSRRRKPAISTWCWAFSRNRRPRPAHR